MTSNKKYGLITADKVKPPVFQASRNVFGNDSESDEDSSRKPVLLRPSDNINRQAKITQNKAFDEDPTVFQYDEVYDGMKMEKELKKIDKSKDLKKPRYIENLMKSAKKRKTENERRIERQIQKEREMEGNEFADKEVFVTSAYKKKLEEMALEEEKEKREEYLEFIGDVTKQRDLGGFYRHLYEQKLGSDKDDATCTLDSKPHENKNIGQKENNENHKTIKHGEEECTDNTSELVKKRNYRKRKFSYENDAQLSEGEVEDSDEEINRLNLNDIKLAKKLKETKDNIDADSDFSIDESSDDENNMRNSNKKQLEMSKKPEDNQIVEKETIININIDEKLTVVTDKKQKIDIWKKRTVGEVFQDALQRYYERKSARSLM